MLKFAKNLEKVQKCGKGVFRLRNQRKIGIILSYIYTATHVVVNLLYVPLLLRTIGQSEYGLYQLVGSLIAYISIMESLLSAGVVRYYCKYKNENNQEKMENVLAISQRIYSFFALIVCVCGVVLIFVFKSVYSSSLTPFEMQESIIMLIFLIANIIINIMNYVYVAVITANEKFIFLKVISILSTIVQPAIVFLLIKKYPYAIVIVISVVLINLIVAFARRIYATKVLNATIHYHGQDRGFVKGLFQLSSAILFALIADQIFWKADQLVIGKMLNTSAVAVYSVGSQIYMNYTPLGTAISSVFMSKLSKLYDVEKDIQSISELFIKVGRIAFLFLGLVLCGFILFGQEFILLWAGEGYKEAYYVAVIIMIPLTVDAMQNLGLTILQVMNKYGFRGKVYFIIAIINIITTVFLVKTVGIVGAAISTAISMAIGNGVIMNLYYNKLGLNIRKFWKEIIKLLPAVVIALICGVFLQKICFTNAAASLLFHIVFFVIIYVISIFVFALTRKEKSLVIKKMIRLIIR